MNIEQLRNLIRETAQAVFEEKRAAAAAPDLQTVLRGLGVVPAAQPITERGIGIARMIKAIASGRGDVERAANFAKKTWPEDTMLLGAFTKALAAGDAAGGGFLVPIEYSAEIIEFLRARAIVRKLGPTTLPMKTGTLTIPKLATGVTASYVGENVEIAATQPKFGAVTLTFHKLAALVPISNDLIRFSSPQADAVVRDDLVAALAVREDQAFIRDDGTNNTPKGIRNWMPASNVIPANATVNLANVTTDLGKLIVTLLNNNVRMIRPGWMFSPRTWNYLMTVQTTTGAYAFREEMLTGKLWGYPFGVTTTIPITLGGGANESEVYLVDFADAVIGEDDQIILDVSMEASYTSNGQTVNAFSSDQTVIRAIARHDFAMRHDFSAAVLTGVTWGA